MIKKFLKKILPQTILNYLYLKRVFFKILSGYIYDLFIYNKFNGAKLNLNLMQLEAKIIAHYHVLEKGLSHPNPKNGFGLSVASSLTRLVRIYEKLAGNRSHQVNVAVGVLKNYVNFHSNKGYLPKEILNEVAGFEFSEKKDAPALVFERNIFFSKKKDDFKSFAASRYSVRDFSEKDVAIDLLREAVAIAQKTPSVCNRQTIRVHILENRKILRDHLDIQNGNRGFGDKVNKLIIVTSDLYCFDGASERNQAFVDGGMFAMSIIYALHYLGVGAVALNWAYSPKQDKLLHKLGVVPENEKVVLFIAVGHVPDSFKVAVSSRKPVEEIIKIS